MNVFFRKSFQKDLLKLRNSRLNELVGRLIQMVEKVQTLSDLPNLKKLKGHKTFYRIRSGEYRIGLQINSEGITFVTVGHRKDIYKNFP